MLDTDITSYLIKGHAPGIERKFLEIPPSHVCISVITRAELMYGLKRLPAHSGLHRLVHQLLGIIQVLLWNEVAADHYAEIRHQLVSSGQPIGDMDMMIAAHALALGATLVTNNTRHFSRINAPLILANWPRG